MPVFSLPRTVLRTWFVWVVFQRQFAMKLLELLIGSIFVGTEYFVVFRVVASLRSSCFAKASWESTTEEAPTKHICRCKGE